MEKSFEHSKHGTIIYRESVWTGAKSIYIKGTPLRKVSAKVFSYNDDGNEIRAFVNGSDLSGKTLLVDGETFIISTKTFWYEYILAFLPLLVNIIWGNSIDLCLIIPVVGGAIGGGVNGMIAVFSIMFMKKTNNPLFKVLIGLACLIVSFAICYFIALGILSSAA